MRKKDASRHRVVPWKNGGGSTSEIACHEEGEAVEVVPVGAVTVVAVDLWHESR